MIVIVLDSVGYKTFLKADIPNMKSIGEVHLAYSHGSWTLPSFASMFAGIFPACSIPNCSHRKLINPDPYFLVKNRFKVFTNNPWIEVLAGKLGGKVVKINSTRDVLKYINDVDNAFIHVMETHFHMDEEWTEEIQIKRLEEADKILKPILSLDDEIIVTADHGENFDGERHGNFDGVFRRYIFEVPILANSTK